MTFECGELVLRRASNGIRPEDQILLIERLEELGLERSGVRNDGTVATIFFSVEASDVLEKHHRLSEVALRLQARLEGTGLEIRTLGFGRRRKADLEPAQ